MPVFETDISGDGSAALGFGNVIYAVCHLSSVGGPVRELEQGSPDHILRAGWFAFGDTLNVIGGVNLEYWRAPIWLDFVNTLFTPLPSGIHAGAALVELGTIVRWHVAIGCAGHLYVFGD